MPSHALVGTVFGWELSAISVAGVADGVCVFEVIVVTVATGGDDDDGDGATARGALDGTTVFLEENCGGNCSVSTACRGDVVIGESENEDASAGCFLICVDAIADIQKEAH